MIYTTKQGDELDLICWKVYGTEVGTTEVVLRVNRDLAELLPILPPGLKIKLPELQLPRINRQPRLWEVL